MILFVAGVADLLLVLVVEVDSILRGRDGIGRRRVSGVLSFGEIFFS